MLRLDSTLRSLQVLLAGAVATSQPSFLASWSDATSTGYAGGSTPGNTNSTTAVTLVAAPAASTVRDVDYVSVRNRDTAPVTVTVRYNDNGTPYDITSVELAVGSQLVYAHGSGWQVIDVQGSIKSGLTGPQGVAGVNPQAMMIDVPDFMDDFQGDLRGFSPAYPSMISPAITGATRITDSSSSAALAITQAGTGNSLLVEDNTSPDGSPFVIDASGKAILGTTTADATQLLPGGFFQLHDTAGNCSVQQTVWSATAGSAPFNIMSKSKGASVGTRVAVASGDVLGTIAFCGDDGTSFVRGAQIKGEVDGAVGTTDMPGRIIFSTSADGSAFPTERMRIDSAGQTLVTGYLRATTDVRAGGAMMFTASPTNSNATVTATAASLIDGIRTGTPAAAIDLQLPTGTDLDSAFSALQTNMTFQWSVINLAAATHAITVTANTDHTVVGAMDVPAATSATFLTRKTTTNTFVTYRI